VIYGFRVDFIPLITSHNQKNRAKNISTDRNWFISISDVESAIRLQFPRAHSTLNVKRGPLCFHMLSARWQCVAVRYEEAEWWGGGGVAEWWAEWLADAACGLALPIQSRAVGSRSYKNYRSHQPKAERNICWFQLVIKSATLEIGWLLARINKMEFRWRFRGCFRERDESSMMASYQSE